MQGVCNRPGTRYCGVFHTPYTGSTDAASHSRMLKMNTRIDHLGKIRYPRTRLRWSRQVVADIDKLLEDIRKWAKRGLHLGAGSSKLPGLINCDLYNPEADLKADAVNLPMFEDGSIDVIESHHMIEHLSFKDTDSALTEWNRVLRDRGLVVLTFPDITAVAVKWIRHSLAYPILRRPDETDYIVHMFVGSQENEGMFHRNAYDSRRMSRTLSRYGFRVEFTYYRYPIKPTPSRLVIARKTKSL